MGVVARPLLLKFLLNLVYISFELRQMLLVWYYCTYNIDTFNKVADSLDVLNLINPFTAGEQLLIRKCMVLELEKRESLEPIYQVGNMLIRKFEKPNA